MVSANALLPVRGVRPRASAIHGNACLRMPNVTRLNEVRWPERSFSTSNEMTIDYSRRALQLVFAGDAESIGRRLQVCQRDFCRRGWGRVLKRDGDVLRSLVRDLSPFAARVTLGYHSWSR